MTDEFVSVREVAVHFGLTTAAIYKYVRLGRIANAAPAGSNAVRITRAEFDYIKANGLRSGAPSGNRITSALVPV